MERNFDSTKPGPHCAIAMIGDHLSGCHVGHAWLHIEMILKAIGRQASSKFLRMNVLELVKAP